MKTAGVTCEQRAQLLDSLGTFKTCGDRFAPESVDAAAKQIKVVLSVTEEDVAAWLARERARPYRGEATQLDDIPFFILVGQLSLHQNCEQYIRQHIDAVAFSDMKVYLAALLFLQGNRDAKVSTILKTALKSRSLIDPREMLAIEQAEQIKAAVTAMGDNKIPVRSCDGSNGQQHLHLQLRSDR
jgi:hypothetical protein